MLFSEIEKWSDHPIFEFQQPNAYICRQQYTYTYVKSHTVHTCLCLYEPRRACAYICIPQWVYGHASVCVGMSDIATITHPPLP